MNLDKLRLFPNQILDGDFTECVGLSVADIAGNIWEIPFNADFTYAASLYIQGKSPTTAGTDPRAGMYSGCAYGFLPDTDETFTASTVGELYAANLNNYSAQQKAQALPYAIPSKPVAADWKSVLAKLDAGVAVSLPLKWYPNFLIPVNGVLQAPQGFQFSLHNVAVYGYDERGLIFKPWLGPDWGDHGYGYMPEAVYNEVGLQPYCFDTNASRFNQLISLSIVYYPVLIGYVKSLFK
jgi:hypothetical protein